MPVIPTNLSPEQQDDQSISAIKINKILSDRLPVLVGGKIPIDANLSLSSQNLTVSNEVEIKNDTGNPVPVSSTNLSNIDADLGALADSAASSDTGSFSLISLFKRLLSTKIPDASSGRIPVTLASAGATGTSSPATANLVAGSDLSGQLRAISTDGSGRLVVNVNSSGTSVSLSSFSLTAVDSSLVTANTLRKSLTVFNTGPGLLYIAPGTTCSTSSYQVRLSAGDYWEAPLHQVTLAHSAVFATAGSAAVTSIT